MSNLKTMIEIIETNRALMDAHTQKLSFTAPAVDISALDNCKDSTQLLHAVIAGNIQGAASALKNMAEVEADFFKKFTSQNAADQLLKPKVIDVEVKQITEG